MKKVYLIIIFVILTFMIGSCSSSCYTKEEEIDKFVSFAIDSPDSVRTGETIELSVKRYVNGVYDKTLGGNGDSIKHNGVTISPQIGTFDINGCIVEFTGNTSGSASIFITGYSKVLINDWDKNVEFYISKIITVHN